MHELHAITPERIGNAHSNTRKLYLKCLILCLYTALLLYNMRGLLDRYHK
jgi:hypothetical protein